MSSEQSTTSSSSRLSQFGLYRTIDARTEEFLKLSKKRQIRQGCACAVISTAITITIVIAVFLIYEYNGYSDPNAEKGLSNTSNITKYANMKKSSSKGINGKLNKNKHIVSHSTINLLNILLKALNHTHNLENQEKVKNSPTLNKVATGIPFQRNVFSDLKNWIRIPNIRMLAPEQKAPSIFYYRNPTPNVRLATNTRKPSIYPWTNLPKASDEVLEQPHSSIKKDDQRILIIMETTTAQPQKHAHCSGSDSDCKCNNLSVFMCKLLSNIQELYPGVILNATLCSNFRKPNKKNTNTSDLLNTNTDLITSENKAFEKMYATKEYQGKTEKHVITTSMYEKYQKHLLTNTNKSARASKVQSKPIFQNKVTEIPPKTQLQWAIHTTKSSRYTTEAIQPYIVAPEMAEYLKKFIKATTTATKGKSETKNKTSKKIQETDTIEKHIVTTDLNKEYLEYVLIDTNKSTNAIRSQHKQKQTSGEKQANRTLEVTNITSKYIATVAVDKYKKNLIANINKSKKLGKNGSQNNGQTKQTKLLSKSQFQFMTLKTTKMPEYTTTTVRPYIVAPEIVEPIITTTTVSRIKQYKIKQNIDIEKIKDEIIRITEITTQKETSTPATMKNHHNIEQNLDIQKISDGMLKTIKIKTQNGTSTAATTTKHHVIKQNLNNEKVLEKTIKSMEIITQKETSTAATTSKHHKIEQNLDTRKILEGKIRSTEITTQMEISTDASTTKFQKIEQKLDLETESEKTTESSVQPTRTSIIAKYFKDDVFAENKLFKDIKFARFDSFAANSNKHILLPSYKDINFELFPVYKRHNTYRPKFNAKSESLVNTNRQTDNDFTEIMSMNKKDDYISSSNEIFSTLPSKNYSKITNELPNKSSSTTNEDTSPVDWMYEVKMINNIIKETLKEQINDTNKETNNVLQKSTKAENQILPKIFSSADKHAIWTYSIDDDVEITKRNISDNESERYETTEKSKIENLFLSTKPSKTDTNKHTVSISQLYDTKETLMNYFNKTIEPKINESDKQRIKLTSYDSEDLTFFEDKIQEKLKTLRDTRSKENNKEDLIIKYVIPNEIIADNTENNPSSMLPKSRPSYLVINRNFLNIGNDRDYQINKINYKQKRQDYDYLYDIFV